MACLRGSRKNERRHDPRCEPADDPRAGVAGDSEFGRHVSVTKAETLAGGLHFDEPWRTLGGVVGARRRLAGRCCVLDCCGLDLALARAVFDAVDRAGCMAPTGWGLMPNGFG